MEEKYSHPKPRKSVADKLYDLITVSPTIGSKYLSKVWNLENRVYAVQRFLTLIGTLKDKHPTYEEDLETFTKCVEALEEKSRSSHWQKVFSRKNRRLKRRHVEDTIDSLKSYIGTEALKKGKTYNQESNTLEDMAEIEPILFKEPTKDPAEEEARRKRLMQKIAYV